MSSLRFSGGYPIQRGRGIGGLLRTVVSIFKPVAKTIGKSAVKAVKSDTAKMIGQSLKEQAINSALNLTSEAIRGNDLNESLKNEMASTRNTIGDVVENTRSSLLKRKRTKDASEDIKAKRGKMNRKTKTNTGKKRKKQDYIWER